MKKQKQEEEEEGEAAAAAEEEEAEASDEGLDEDGEASSEEGEAPEPKKAAKRARKPKEQQGAGKDKRRKASKPAAAKQVVAAASVSTPPNPPRPFSPVGQRPPWHPLSRLLTAASPPPSLAALPPLSPLPQSGQGAANSRRVKKLRDMCKAATIPLPPSVFKGQPVGSLGSPAPHAWLAGASSSSSSPFDVSVSS